MRKNVIDANSKLNNSNKNLKLSYEKSHDKNLKLLYMPHWIEFYSASLKNEVLRKQKYYKTFSKGAIIYVKLGSNIGSEFSGNHFCVVLDNKDNKMKETITIVPLSSKNNKNYIKLNTTLFDLTIQNLKIKVSKCRKNLDNLTSKNKNCREEYVFSNDENSNFKNIEKQVSEIETLLNIYGKHKNKETFANISGITTLSKKRIMKINDSDPTGEMIINDNDLKNIHEQIQVKYLYNNC
ncbi:type II toxin-antitoxin system PemK/MazF family toxin [Staphylococcus sp. IPLA37010]|uniref:Endoribonuclease MazF n=1 Tax=Staphylococcus equorum TaxID=246432 RepID=A0AAW7AMC0_9STAP|nr:type II toxin-antitoxin system PemK/MazF family toxin [Staphylococcus equorum]MDK9866685.1 type II toxin-antitoxin system PemK/MazF family toxin [Staphylococcus equorum]